jgi:hypothetical protein
MVSERDLQSRVDRLEAELISAKALAAEAITTKKMEVGQLAPYSMFDKHGALAIVFAIFIQTMGAIWWAAGLSAQVDALRDGAAQRDQIINAMSRTIQENAERLSRVQAVQENVVKILDRFQTEFNERGPKP